MKPINVVWFYIVKPTAWVEICVASFIKMCSILLCDTSRFAPLKSILYPRNTPVEFCITGIEQKNIKLYSTELSNAHLNYIK